MNHNLLDYIQVLNKFLKSSGVGGKIVLELDGSRIKTEFVWINTYRWLTVF